MKSHTPSASDKIRAPRRPFAPAILGLCSLLVFTVPLIRAAADTPISTDSLAAQVLARHPALRMAEAEIAAARGDRTKAGMWRNPEISAAAGHKRVSDGSIQNDGASFSVQISQTFEFPGKATLRKAIADKNITLAEMALEQFKRSLEARVRGSAGKLLATEKQMEVARWVAAEADLIAAALKDRPAAGTQQVLEARLIEASLVEVRKSLLESESLVVDLKNELNQLRDYPVSAPLRLEASGQPPRDPGTLETLLASASAGHPRVKLMAMELERATASLAAARLTAAPDVSVGPFYSFEQVAKDTESTIGGQVSLPLPLWDQGRGDIATASARRDHAAAAVLLAQREAETEIARSHRQWHLARKILEEVNPSRLADFREAAELAARQFSTGAIPVQLYLEMQREYLEVSRIRHEALGQAEHEAAVLAQFARPAPPQAAAKTKSKKK